jgi:hypothetical protein
MFATYTCGDARASSINHLSSSDQTATPAVVDHDGARYQINVMVFMRDDGAKSATYNAELSREAQIVFARAIRRQLRIMAINQRDIVNAAGTATSKATAHVRSIAGQAAFRFFQPYTQERELDPFNSTGPPGWLQGTRAISVTSSLKPAEVEIGTKVYKLEAQCLVLSGDRLVSDDELTSMLQEHYARFFKEELGID